MIKNVITFGTFDLLHVGHVRLIQRSAKLGKRLIIGVSSDALTIQKKGQKPTFSQTERMEIIKMIKGVDAVFLEEKLELKEEYLKNYQADLLVMGDDWRGKFDFCKSVCQVKYIARTPSISTTAIVEKLKS
jgi:glycerol-3-phosphate cytidylyltransferase